MIPARIIHKFSEAMVLVALSGCTAALAANEVSPKPRFDLVPGVVIDHSPASSGLYIGSPSIAVLSNGDYVASHDFFGPKSDEHTSARSAVFRSTDGGQSWRQVSGIQGAFWSSLFVHRGALYLLGPDRHHGNILIRRSTDGGETWSSPTNATTGLLRDHGDYHCAPMPVIEHRGRLWRAFEWRNPPVAWGINYRAGMLSAPVEADLLNATNWTASNFVPSDRAWNNADVGAWLEGNAVVAPGGGMADPGPANDRAPESELRLISGWTVHVHESLLATNAATTVRALALLTAQLNEIVRVVPPTALVELRKVQLWVSPEYPGMKPRAEYHPNAQWLRDHDRDPAMAQGVEVTNVRIFEAETRRMPNFALHELAHAYHDLVLGNHNAEIKAAYERANPVQSPVPWR